jgi:hypothetical protein
MMQRDRGAADFLHERVASRQEFLEIGRTERCLGRAGKDKIGDF